MHKALSRGRLALLLPALVFCLVLPRRAAAQWCDHRAERTASANLAGVERVHVISGAGDLEVTGADGATTMSTRGVACASEAELLDDLQIDVRRDGSTLVIEAKYPEERSIRREHASLAMNVTIAAGMPVFIEDGSGDVRLSGVGAARVDDGSGDLRASDVRGALTIEDGSGNVEIDGVAGSVEIEDGSGDVEVRNASGAVEVDDGSGDVRITQVRGSVRLNDGSGDLRVIDVTQNVIVDDDGSGSIVVERIGGNFTVDDDGSGGISYSQVSGQVSVPDDD